MASDARGKAPTPPSSVTGPRGVPDMRLTIDLNSLKQVLDEMKAQGLYPVSIRLVPKRKPN